MPNAASTVVAYAPTVALGHSIDSGWLRTTYAWDVGMGAPFGRVLTPLRDDPGHSSFVAPAGACAPTCHFAPAVAPDAPRTDLIRWPEGARAALLLLLFDETSLIALRAFGPEAAGDFSAPRVRSLKLRSHRQTVVASRAADRPRAVSRAVEAYLETACLRLGSPGLLLAA